MSSTQIQNKGRRILGIDPGYDRCGVAIVEGTMQKPRLVFSCCIETDRKQSFPERILFIFKCLSDIIEEHKPTDCSIEDLFFTTNQKTAIKVAEARGVCLLAAAYFKLKIGEYTPLQVKTYLTSYGRADKKQVYFIVEKILKLDFSGKTKESVELKKEWSQKQDDEIDAIAIALTHLFVSK
jgi:crossover junction endodeoxyribonuclease RuvC